MIELGSLFDTAYGHSLELNRLVKTTPSEGIPFISRKMGDNGVAAYVRPVAGVAPNPAGELTCALSGNGVLTTCIQERPYYTGFHIACLRPKVRLTKQQLLYYCVCLTTNRYRYGFGRQANKSLRGLMVPSPSEIPNWVNDRKLDLFSGVESPVSPVARPALAPDRWRKFKIGDLFTLHKGRRLTKANMSQGDVPFIGAIDNNNGLTARVAQPANHPAGTITVNYNGNGVAEAFFQPVAYRCSDDVNVLYPKAPLDVATALFVATVIRQEKYRFSYGRKWHLERMRDAEIRLPSKPDESPDWEFMRKYILAAPFSSQI